MATKRQVGKRGVSAQQGMQSAAVKSKLRKALKDIGGVKFTDKQPEPAAYEIVYKVDDFRSLLIEISIKPLIGSPVMHMTVEPGKVKIKR
ncbi:MAG: hypothetical protein NVV60_05030 [Luteimonas sp.]|nr:hypothetical protein [Luteimonas sp.]